MGEGSNSTLYISLAYGLGGLGIFGVWAFILWQGRRLRQLLKIFSES